MRLRPFFYSGRKNSALLVFLFPINKIMKPIKHHYVMAWSINNKREAFWAFRCRQGVMGVFCDTPNTVLQRVVRNFGVCGGCRGRLTIVLDDDWLFFDTPKTVLDVLIGAWRAQHLTYEEH